MTERTSTTRANPLAKASAKAAAAPAGASHIPSPVRGPRTISHRQIKSAIEKVFRERDLTRA